MNWKLEMWNKCDDDDDDDDDDDLVQASVNMMSVFIYLFI